MISIKPLFVVLALITGTSFATADEFPWLSWDYQGDAVAYRVDGAGPPVVQIHGIGAGASSAQTQYQISALVDAGYSVYSVDLLGWGRSIGPARIFTANDYVDLINTFLNEVVVEPAALVGHSLGGTFAIGAAADNPHQVTALVLNAPVGVTSFTNEPGPFNERLWEWIVGTDAGQALYEALGSWPSITSFCRRTLYVDPTFCDTRTVYEYRRFTRQPDSIYGAASFLSSNLGLDVGSQFAELEIPVLLIWGVDNVFTPVSEGDAFVDLNPTATLAELSPGGAMVNDEQSDDFNGLLVEHLNKHHP